MQQAARPARRGRGAPLLPTVASRRASRSKFSVSLKCSQNWQEGESELQEVERQLAKAPVKSGPRDKLAAVDSEAVGGAGFDGNSLKPIASSNGKALPAARPAAACATAVARRLFSPVFLEAFVLTFLAEWGDRSQARSLPTACDFVAESQR